MKKLFSLTVLSLAMTVCLISFSNAGTPNDNRVIAGPVDAPLTIQEFVDFQCGYCAQGANTVALLLKDYPGKINLVLRNMPLAKHTNATEAAKAFSAVYLQSPSLAYQFQKNIFEHQDKLNQSADYIYELAQLIGVDVSKMKQDMSGQEVTAMLAEDQKLMNDNHFGGTPSFLIGDEAVQGAYPYNEMKQIVEKHLAP